MKKTPFKSRIFSTAGQPKKSPNLELCFIKKIALRVTYIQWFYVTKYAVEEPLLLLLKGPKGTG